MKVKICLRLLSLQLSLELAYKEWKKPCMGIHLKKKPHTQRMRRPYCSECPYEWTIHVNRGIQSHSPSSDY